MEGKYFLRTDNKPNELGELMINIQYCTQGVPCKKKTGISIKPEYWLGDNGNGKYVKGGPSGHPKASILNQRLVNLKKEYDSIIDSLLVQKNQVIASVGATGRATGNHCHFEVHYKGQVVDPFNYLPEKNDAPANQVVAIAVGTELPALDRESMLLASVY